ncbi:MAG: hypothetical protein RL220_360, partial [Bacteroidota bacterium]
CMDFSASAEIWKFFRKYKLSQLVSVAENAKPNEISVFGPNPSSGVVQLYSNSSEQQGYSLLGADGKLLNSGFIQFGLNSIELPHNGLSYIRIHKTGQVIKLISLPGHN